MEKILFSTYLPYDVDLVKEIKDKINKGLKIKEFTQLYPKIRKEFYSELKNGKKWNNI